VTAGGQAAPVTMVMADLTGFWDILEDVERDALRAAARRRTFPNRMPLCHQGDDSDHVVVIESGWAKVTSATEDGHEVMLAVRGPGDLVCEGAVLGHRRRSATVAAISPLRSLVISAGRFTAFLDEFPRTWRLVSETVVRRLDDADRRVQAHACTSGTQRLALLLVELAEQYGEPAPDGGIEVRPALSQEELAGMVDTSRETLARALRDWRTLGLVQTGWRKIIILDLPGLRAMCP
jgi:CRP/FNR family transcriptional regulator, cyclic AMP receptor protein